METTFIQYEVENRIATITLNRPEAANAQTLPMLDDLDEAWRRAAELLEEGKLSSKQLKGLFDIAFEKGEDFGVVYDREKPEQISDTGALGKIATAPAIFSIKRLRRARKVSKPTFLMPFKATGSIIEGRAVRFDSPRVFEPDRLPQSPSFTKLGDLCSAISKHRTEHLVGMLPDQRSGRFHLAVCPAHLARDAAMLTDANLRMFESNEIVARLQMSVFCNVFVGRTGKGRHVGLLENIGTLGCSSRRCPLRDYRFEFILVLFTGRKTREPRVAGKLGLSDCPGKPSPVGVVCGND